MLGAAKRGFSDWVRTGLCAILTMQKEAYPSLKGASEVCVLSSV